MTRGLTGLATGAGLCGRTDANTALASETAVAANVARVERGGGGAGATATTTGAGAATGAAATTTGAGAAGTGATAAATSALDGEIGATPGAGAWASCGSGRLSASLTGWPSSTAAGVTPTSAATCSVADFGPASCIH